MSPRKCIASQFGKEMVTKIFRPSTTTLRGTMTLSRSPRDTLIPLMTHRTRRGATFMRRMVDAETSRLDPTNQPHAGVSRRSFLKSATVAAVLGGAAPQALMAETKEGMPQRALGRTGEKVSAIGLGGYHLGKQADEA